LQTEPKIIQNFLPGKEVRDTTQNYIVIHNDGGNLNAKTTRLVLRTRRLSYHFFIENDGTIHQFMDLRYRAKHAGVSRWNGLFDWNSFSIGIALQGTDNTEYSCEQYTGLKNLLNFITMRYPDVHDKPVLRHSDIAWPRGRKHDPGIYFEPWRLQHDITCIPGR
jgi:N-acetyl-anhydromuramyl-L-alanine amidase AmpD